MASDGVACPYCPRRLANDHGLKTHVYMVHGDPDEQKPKVQASGVCLEAALERLTGEERSVDEWREAEDLDALAELVLERSFDVHRELADDELGPTDYPGRRPETDATNRGFD